MKINIRKYLAAVPLVLALGLACSIPAMAEPSGHLDWANRSVIAGWSWDAADPDEAMEVKIDITPTGAQSAARTLTVTAESYRGDLVSGDNDGNHGFFCPVDWTQFSGDSFTVTAYVLSGDKKFPLAGTVSYHTSAEGPVLAVVSADTQTGTAGAIFGPVSGSVSLPSDGVEIVKESKEDSSTTEKSNSESEQAKENAGKANSDAGQAKESDKKTDTETEQTKESKANSVSGPVSGSSGSKSDSAKEPASESGWKKGQSLGYFTITGYCSCAICSGGWGLTYSGTVPQANHTISADLNVLPLGTKVMINGIVYTVEDKGSGVNGNHIDIYYATHAEAEACGTRSAEVFSVIAE